MNLLEISWPVFRLGEHKPRIENGIVYYSKEYLEQDTTDTRVGLRIVDDKSISGTSLGARRLKLQFDPQAQLFPIKTTVYFLADLIKYSKPTTWWIDSTGRCFQYKKSTRAKLTCHKLAQVLPLDGMGAVVEAAGIPQRFKCLYSPRPDQHYVGVLRWGLGYILYGFYEQPFKASYRSV